MPPLDNSAEYANPVPRAIRRQVEQADEIARELGISGVAPLEDPAPQPEPEPQPEPVPEPVVEEPPASAPAVEEPDYRARYDTLRGKYESEIPSLRNQVAQLERLIASMNTAPAPEPVAPEPRVTTVPVEIPQAMIDEYGQDLVDFTRRVARAELQGEFEQRLAELERQFTSRVQRVETGQQTFEKKTTVQTVFDRLDADPEIGTRWRDLDVHPDFLAWLDQADPFAGERRLLLLQKAVQQGDAVRAGRFFKTYIAEHTAIQPPTPTPAETAPVEQADRPSLESLAAPGRPTGVGPTNSGAPEKRIWTNREIAAFYRNAQKGAFVGREAEKQRLEIDIIAAASEGRIRNV